MNTSNTIMSATRDTSHAPIGPCGPYIYIIVLWWQFQAQGNSLFEAALSSCGHKQSGCDDGMHSFWFGQQKRPCTCRWAALVRRYQTKECKLCQARYLATFNWRFACLTNCSRSCCRCSGDGCSWQRREGLLYNAFEIRRNACKQESKTTTTTTTTTKQKWTNQKQKQNN